MTQSEKICKKLMEQGKWNKSMCYLCRRRVKGEECKLRKEKKEETWEELKKLNMEN